VALFTLGRAILSLVTAFTLIVESVFSFGRSSVNTMATSAGSSFNTLMVALFTIRNSSLVSGMIESYSPHAGFKLDFSGTIVCHSKQSSTGNETENNQQNDQLFHVSLLLVYRNGMFPNWR